jgi:hypothetical protein
MERLNVTLDDDAGNGVELLDGSRIRARVTASLPRPQSKLEVLAH